MLIHKTFRYKLKPTSTQERTFVQWAGACRWVWNYMLAWRIEARKNGEKTPNQFEQMPALTVLKKQEGLEWLGDVYAQTLREPIQRLEKSYKAFFSALEKKKKGKATCKVGAPKFKSKRGKQSFCFPDYVKAKDGKVYLPKIGWVGYFDSCPIEGEVKTATIKKEASGWHVSLHCEVGVQEYGNVPLSESNTTGIDLGLIDFYTTSESKSVPVPKYYRKAQKKLAKAERQKSRKQKGSNRRKRQAHKITRLHEKIANQRKDFLHKHSTQLIRENQAVMIENLNIAGMAKNRRLAKSVSDIGWGMFVYMLEYKAKWASKTVHKVDRFFPSSKTCHSCGTINTLKLSDRVFTCEGCGDRVLRDANAAKNIRDKGLLDLSSEGHSEANARGAIVRLALASGL